MRLREEIEQVFAAGKVPGRSGREFPLFPTALTRELGEELRDLAVREGVRQTVETGLGLGISTLFLTAALLEDGSGAGRHVAIDPWQLQRFDGAGLLTLERAGVRSTLEFHEEDSKLCLPRLLQEGRSFDLAFVDGDHRFEGVFLDLYFLYQLVRPGGLVVVDDLWLPAVRTAVSYFVRNLGGTVEPLGAAPSREERIVTLRVPDPRPRPAWDEFVPFWDPADARGPAAGSLRSRRKAR